MPTIKRLAPSVAICLFALVGGCQANDIVKMASVAGPGLVVSEQPWSYYGAAGKEIRTHHYQIFTTHGDPVVVERLPQLLETAFIQYQQLVKPTCQPGNLMQVYLFARRDQWDRFTAETAGSAAKIYLKIQEGGYVHNGRAVFYDIRRLKTFAVTGHEAFHQFLGHYSRYRPPAWLDEGIACYFEGFFWDGDDLRFAPRDNLLRKRALQHGLTTNSTLPLGELLATHPGNVIGSNPSRVSAYYGQLWALVLFLNDSKYASCYRRMLADIGSQRMFEQAARFGYRGGAADFGLGTFKAYIQPDLAAAEREFHNYCRELAGL